MADESRACIRLMRRRARKVLSTYSNGELERLLPDIEEFGETAVFGGLLRDMAFDVPSSFSSDVDLVVDTRRYGELGTFLEGIGATKNRHGGYRLDLTRGQLDIWPLHNTWAFRRGLINNPTFQRLPKTTFFTWDSVVYIPSTRKFHATEAFRRAVTTMTVDIELPDNPYPLGAAVRALRILLSGRAALAPSLAIHQHRIMETFTNREMIDAEITGFTHRYLSERALDTARCRLQEHVTHSAMMPFRLIQQPHQLSLPFSGAVAIGDEAVKRKPDRRAHSVDQIGQASS